MTFSLTAPPNTFNPPFFKPSPSSLPALPKSPVLLEASPGPFLQYSLESTPPPALPWDPPRAPFSLMGGRFTFLSNLIRPPAPSERSFFFHCPQRLEISLPQYSPSFDDSTFNFTLLGSWRVPQLAFQECQVTSENFYRQDRPSFSEGGCVEIFPFPSIVEFFFSRHFPPLPPIQSSDKEIFRYLRLAPL